MKNRRLAREIALKTLYSIEMGTEGESSEVLHDIAEQEHCGLEARNYATLLVANTRDHVELLDSALQKHTSNWKIDRLSAIDRNILRMAVAELWYHKEVPYRVVIDEAVEIAKLYGTDDSGKFVNGVIDSVRKTDPDAPETDMEN